MSIRRITHNYLKIGTNNLVEQIIFDKMPGKMNFGLTFKVIIKGRDFGERPQLELGSLLWSPDGWKSRPVGKSPRFSLSKPLGALASIF